MRVLRHFLVVLFVPLAVLATQAADPIRLPVGPTPPAPNPAPLPGPIGSLAADQWYVIDSDVPLMVLASPTGIVSVSEAEAGPVKLKGKFVDGSGKTETRSYKGKAVFTIEAVTAGRVELLIVPTGAAGITDVKRVTLDVTAGQAPQPPPTPDVKPKPKPEPSAPGAKLFVVALSDRLLADPTQAAALASTTFRNYLAANGHSLDLIDVSSDAGKARLATYQPFLDKYSVTLPALVLMDAEGVSKGQIRLVASLPKSDADLVGAIKGVTGK